MSSDCNAVVFNFEDLEYGRRNGLSLMLMLMLGTGATAAEAPSLPW